ncbi:hypothetical protein TMatcc_003333 [Talaromyces marneffei ATCC 18224]
MLHWLEGRHQSLLEDRICSNQDCIGVSTNLIDGGDPAGTRAPEEDGCLTKISTIKIIITQGNINTTPSGIETVELPRNRIRRRRKAKGDNLVPFSRDTSSKDARAGADGRRLTIRRTIFMVAVQAPRARERLTQVKGEPR